MLTSDGNYKNQTNKLAKKETNPDKNNISYKPKNNFARAAQFFVHFFAQPLM